MAFPQTVFDFEALEVIARLPGEQNEEFLNFAAYFVLVAVTNSDLAQLLSAAADHWGRMQRFYALGLPALGKAKRALAEALLGDDGEIAIFGGAKLNKSLIGAAYKKCGIEDRLEAFSRAVARLKAENAYLVNPSQTGGLVPGDIAHGLGATG